MPSLIFNSTIKAAATGRVDFSFDTFRVMLLSDAYRPDRKNHANRSHIVEAEVSGLGYESGGNTVPVEVIEDSTNNRVDVSLGGTEWEFSTIRARGAAYYKAQNGELIAYIDFGKEVASSSGLFELTASTLRIQN
jgi:hypothetical protein